MTKIDAELEKEPTPELVAELAEARIRNLMCFAELETFNNTGKFKNKHPLIKNFTQRQLMVKLRREDPEQFLFDFADCRENVKRYKSFLNREKISNDQRNKWETQLNKHNTRLQLMKEVMYESET